MTPDGDPVTLDEASGLSAFRVNGDMELITNAELIRAAIFKFHFFDK
ncbi:hypothetical protein J31TS3_12350 [Paenibacillus lactis]|nr:hypothetical protein J31TS3_12350 [Paenibacillus lactis]